MSLIKRAAAEAERLKRAGPKKTSKPVGISVTTTPATEKLIAQLPIEMRNKMMKTMVSRAARPVVAEVKRNLRPHQSERTGTKEKWSKTTKQQRRGNPKNLYQSITQKTKVYDHKGIALAMVGARRPWGNIWTVFEAGWSMLFWGRESGRTYIKLRGMFRRSGETTLSRQEAQMIRVAKDQGLKL